MLFEVAQLPSVQVVENGDFGAPVGKQPINEVAPDEPGATGNNNSLRVIAHARQYRGGRRLERFPCVENKLRWSRLCNAGKMDGSETFCS
jgi:hypothetical protein